MKIEDLSKPLKLVMWDKDKVGSDEKMGKASFDLTKLVPNHSDRFALQLNTKGALYVELELTT